MANAAVTITGTPENPIFNFDIPQGEKGDPGGFNIGTDLGTSNLNTVITPGLYFQGNGNNTTVANNYPKTQPSRATLRVYPVGANVIEQLIEFVPTSTAPFNANRSIYIRSIISGTPNSWVAFNSTRVDQTAGRAIYQWDDLNNREQLIYGDTGNRRIESIIANGWVAGAVVLRRIGNTVSISGYYVNSSTATDDVWIQVSPGFRPMLAGTALAITKSTNVMATLSIDPATGNCAFPGRSAVYGLNGHFNASWTTNDPWPTTLPGTASGTIPNL